MRRLRFNLNTAELHTMLGAARIVAHWRHCPNCGPLYLPAQPSAWANVNPTYRRRHPGEE